MDKPECTAFLITGFYFDGELWVRIGIKLWDVATTAYKTAAKLLSVWLRQISQGRRANSSDCYPLPFSPPSPLPLGAGSSSCPDPIRDSNPIPGQREENRSPRTGPPWLRGTCSPAAAIHFLPMAAAVCSPGLPCFLHPRVVWLKTDQNLSISLFLTCREKSWKGNLGKWMMLYYRTINSLSSHWSGF